MLRLPRYILLSLLLSISLSSCKKYNQYQPLSSSGFSGYDSTRIDKNTVRVTYHGSYSNSNDRVEDYLLYRCAQVTKQYGYDYFTIISSNAQPIVTSTTTPALINTYHKKGHESLGIITPGQTSYFRRSIASKVIKMYHGSKPQHSGNAYNAAEVIQYMKPKVSHN